VSGEVHRLNSEIRETESKQKDIADLQKQIGTYGKTRKVYEAYRKSGWDSGFYEANRADITLHRASKKYFDAQGLKGKLPPIATLKQEWATFESEKKLLYKDYCAVNPRHKELQTALMNADNLLRGNNLQERERQTPKKSYDRGAR
jgi:predicted  nucleic acid-binding Zn-ribbon protein